MNRRGLTTSKITASEFFDHFFDLTDFLLDLTGYLFGGAFVFQVRVVCRMSYFFLNRAFCFVNLARDLVFRAFFHLNLLFVTRIERSSHGLRSCSPNEPNDETDDQ